MHYQRHPEVDHIAVIVQAREANIAHEVECSDPCNGETLWLDAMYIDELAACPE